MKKILRKGVSLIAVLALLFSVLPTTLAHAATDPENSNSVSMPTPEYPRKIVVKYVEIDGSTIRTNDAGEKEADLVDFYDQFIEIINLEKYQEDFENGEYVIYAPEIFTAADGIKYRYVELNRIYNHVDSNYFVTHSNVGLEANGLGISPQAIKVDEFFHGYNGYEDIVCFGYYKLPDEEQDYNFFIAGDDTYKVYIDGTFEFEPSAPGGPSYGTINKFVYSPGFEEDTLVAIDGADVWYQIAGVKAMYSYPGYVYGDEYVVFDGTDNTWWYYVPQPNENGGYEVVEDAQGNKWYEPGYQDDGWEQAIEIPHANQPNTWVALNPGNVKEQWPNGDLYGPNNEDETIFEWIWSGNWGNNDEPPYDDGNDEFDRRVYLRNIDPTPRYTVTFDTVGGTPVPSDQNVVKGDTATEPTAPGKPGYTFRYWTLEGMKYDFNSPVMDNITLVANYIENSTPPANPPTEEIDEDDTPFGRLNYGDHFAYLQGYPDGSVRPTGGITREEVAAIFFRLLDPDYRETIRSMQNEFADVYTSDWSNKHISTLTKGKILKGYSNGTFKPKAKIKRGELAAIASRFDKLDVGLPHGFSDLEGHWSEKYVASAVQKGWVNGYPDGTYRPEKYVTRAEFVTFVNNVLDRHVKLEDILEGTKDFSDLKATGKWYYTGMKIATNSYLYEIVEDQAEEGSTENPDGTVDIDEGETPLGSLVKKTYQKWTELISPIIEM